MHFIAAALWRWHQERASLGDAPCGKQIPAGAPRPQQHQPRSPVLPLSPVPIHVLGQLVPTSVLLARRGDGSPLRWGREPQGCEPLGSEWAGMVFKIKAICVEWAKGVYGNKQLSGL